MSNAENVVDEFAILLVEKQEELQSGLFEARKNREEDLELATLGELYAVERTIHLHASMTDRVEGLELDAAYLELADLVAASIDDLMAYIRDTASADVIRVRGGEVTGFEFVARELKALGFKAQPQTV